VKRLFLILGLCSTLSFLPELAQARVGAKLSELKDEQIMMQFAIRALIKGAATQARIYELTPIGTAAVNKIKMRLQFDAQERLASVELLISKAYQKEDPSAAKRFAAFFLLTQLPLSDTAAAKPLTTEAEYRTEDPNHHVLGDVPVLPAKPTQGYQAIMGRASYSQVFNKTKMTISQVKTDGGWTKIRIEPK
jgi:hypothetical protein